jgi:hypothetical protein
MYLCIVGVPLIWQMSLNVLDSNWSMDTQHLGPVTVCADNLSVRFVVGFALLVIFA